MKGYAANIRKRSVIFVLFSLAFLRGFYFIYWFVNLTNDTNDLAWTQTASGGVAFLFVIISFGIYYFYWLYKLGVKTGEIKGKSRGRCIFRGVGYAIFLWFGILGIIGMCLAQSAVNKAVSRLR